MKQHSSHMIRWVVLAVPLVLAASAARAQTPPVIVSDTFTGADGTLATTHTPDVAPSGATWAVSGGSQMPTLNGGSIGVGTGAGHVQLTIDSGVADMTTRVNYRVGVGPGVGLAFRLTDANNYLLLETSQPMGDVLNFTGENFVEQFRVIGDRSVTLK
jgi:hypothetical protein